MKQIQRRTDKNKPAEELVALAEFVLERRDGLLAGAYDVEIADLDEGTLMRLVSFGVSVRQGERFKLNLDMAHL